MSTRPAVAYGATTSEPPSGSPSKPVERRGVADEAVLVARQRSGEHLGAEVARPVAVEQDPHLRRRSRVAQRRERHPHLQHPAVAGDAAGGVPVEVGRVVLAARVGVDGVVLHAARVGEEHHRRLPVVVGVEDDAAVIGVGRHVVVVADRRADASRQRVGEAEGGVEEVVVVGEPGDVRHRRRPVVPGVGLQPVVDAQRALPAGVGEVAVDVDGAGGAMDLECRPAGDGGGAAGRHDGGGESGGPGEDRRGEDGRGVGAAVPGRHRAPIRSGAAREFAWRRSV